MRTALKSRLFWAARTTGLHAVARESAWRTRRLSVLCYHGISIADEHEAMPWLYISPAQLRRRLEHLRDGGYEVVALHDGLERLAAGTLPPRSVALTFDDGTQDFASRAVPLLREFAAPATVYPTTYYADRGQPIFDIALVYVLWRARGSAADLTAFAGGAVPGLRTAAAGAVTAETIRQRAMADGLSANAKDLLLRRIAERVGFDYDAMVAAGLFQVMSAAEMRALPRALIDVQLHTHRHRVPTNAELLAREVADNRAYFAHAGIESSGIHFCYPNGTYTRAAARCLRRLGVVSGATCNPGLATRRDDPLALPRFVDHARVCDDTFDAWLSGAVEFVPRRRVYGAPSGADLSVDVPGDRHAASLHGLGLPPEKVHQHELA